MMQTQAEECRLLLLLARDLLTGFTSSTESLKRVRKWLHWQQQEGWTEIFKGLEAVDQDNHPELQRALSIGQIESKLWLIDVLRGVLPERRYRFTVVAGWVGFLSAMLWRLMPDRAESFVQLDIDARANSVARVLNAAMGHAFTALDQDALLHDYDATSTEIIINTSCEHFEKADLDFWLKKLPPRRIVVLQSNNFKGEPGHVNCYENVFAFRKSLDLLTYLYVGELELEKYKRFMVIGITKG